MSTKRIMFIAMCALLVLTGVLTGIVIHKVTTLFGGGLGALENFGKEPGTAPTGESTTAPTETEPTETEPTETEPDGTLATEPPHDHSYSPNRRVWATCDTMGYTEYRCSCGKLKLDDFVEPGHDLDLENGVVTPPACEVGGYTSYLCKRCGQTITRNPVDALVHIMDDGVQMEASCGVDAHTLFSCTREGCQYTEKKDVQEGTALEHILDDGVSVEASCGVDAHTLFSCTREGCQYTEKRDVQEGTALSHDFGEWGVTAEGLIQRTCSHCQTKETAPQKIMGQMTVEDKQDGEEKSYKLYTVKVGNDQFPEVTVYTVSFYDDNGTLTYTYEDGKGLKIQWTDGGETNIQSLTPANKDYTITLPPPPVEEGGEPNEPGGGTEEPGGSQDDGNGGGQTGEEPEE